MNMAGVITQPWFWLTVGIVLLIFEILLSTGFLFGLSFAAFIHSIVLKVSAPMPLWENLTIFSVDALALSLLSYWLFNRFIRTQKTNDKLNDRAAQLVGRILILEEDIGETGGRVQIGDTFWRVKTATTLNQGNKVRVTGSEGMVLILERVEEGS